MANLICIGFVCVIILMTVCTLEICRYLRGIKNELKNMNETKQEDIINE